MSGQQALPAASPRAIEHAGLGRVVSGDADVAVTGVQHDSRRVSPGDLFVAISGERYDGSAFVADAVAKGAVAVLSARELDVDVAQIVAEDPRKQLGFAAELVYGKPTSALKLVGITGTNGKTTTAYLLGEVLRACGVRAATLGTTGFRLGESNIAQTHTTPEADDISRYARDAIDQGATHFVIEASSHGLSLGRVDALDFDVAAFTNLSQDHLDYHGTLEAYGAAKARLFRELKPRVSVINIDDAFGAALAAELSGTVIRCSKEASSTADVKATEWSANRDGIRASLETRAGKFTLESPMWGEHNLENILVAVGCALGLELDLETAIRGLAEAGGSPGRLEQVTDPRGVAVFVDYAHTPDALGRVLDALRPLTPGRLLVVFGAGGDRDRGKRPKMGFEAASRADVCIVTNDNPRSENPQDIADQVAAGAVEAGATLLSPEAVRTSDGCAVVLDRRSAIRIAIESAAAGDTVLLAGKGHETTQVIGDERLEFSDREEARRAIAAVGAR